ncbi:MAG: universal stress protein [Deltaproteobacteria bacterium]|nr:universal stress protein [Deltaproteobacteria bacterium]
MRMVEDILVPVNLSAMSDHAMADLKLIQETFNSHIELLHVVPDSPFYVENEALLEEAINLRLERIKDRLSHNGVHVAKVTIQHGAAYERIIEYAHLEKKNLIFVDETNLKEDDADTTIDKIIRKALTPVWVVTPNQTKRGAVDVILCAYDISENSARIVKNAIVLAKGFSCELHLLHVIEQSSYSWWTGTPTEEFETYAQQEIEAADKFLDDFAFGDLKTARIFLRGKPHEEILLQVNETEPDLMIIGTRGQSGLRTLLIGAVSERVIPRLKTPFLTMKEQNVFELPDRTFIESQLGKEELLARAQRLQKAGFAEEAIFYLKQYLKLNDRKMSAYDLIASCYRDVGNDKKAEQYLELAKQIKNKLWEKKVHSEIVTRKRS